MFYNSTSENKRKKEPNNLHTYPAVREWMMVMAFFTKSWVVVFFTLGAKFFHRCCSFLRCFCNNTFVYKFTISICKNSNEMEKKIVRVKISDDEGIIQIFFPASLKIFLIDGWDEDDDAAKHHIIKKGYC